MQKKIFLDFEGDNFFERNKAKWFNEKDLIIKKITQLNNKKKIHNLLEIGCGDGWRLNLINKKTKINCYGIDPSKKAVKNINNKKLKIFRGTADKLNFKSIKFDVVVFGFCLYLVDIQDLNKVVHETDKVLKKNSIIVIYDFHSNNSKILDYKHNKNVKIHMYDFSKMFLGYPQYKLIEKKIFDMRKNSSKNSKNKKVLTSISVIKKS